MQEIVKSVGIDIGTSTTQLVFSRLVVENLAGSYAVPRVSIVQKEVVYPRPRLTRKRSKRLSGKSTKRRA